MPHDVARTAIVGGHDRQAAGGRLQQGEPEGLREGRVHEHPAQARSPAVEGRDLSAAVLLGVGHPAIQIEAIHQLEHLLKQLPLLLLQGGGILTAAEHQHQVVALPQQG